MRHLVAGRTIRVVARSNRIGAPLWFGAMYRLVGAVVVALALEVGAWASEADFVTFESGPVRPLAISPDGSRLFAANTPDGRLEIFAIESAGLRHLISVPVGLEPVAVAARSDTEVWVVNHLSDSVSVVSLEPGPPRVVRTLFVGDEPSDVVFAGPGRSRAFVTTAARGQHRPGEPRLTEPGLGRADVWVFDALDPGAAPGGSPLGIVTLFGDTPRALAVSPDGGDVYAAVFRSGNQTTIVSEQAVCDGGATARPCEVGGFLMPGGLPLPNANVEGVPGPETGLIVRFDRGSGHWLDTAGRVWDGAVGIALPDLDVFRVDATTLEVTAAYPHVGTVLYGMTVNPRTGAVYVSNTEARNEVRFEGPGVFGGSSVRGHLHEARVTILYGDGRVVPRHLNPHVDYRVVPSPPGVKERSLAMPLGMAVSGDGATLWVEAFGSGVVAALDLAALEAGTYEPDAADQVALSGGGPVGLVLDEPRARLYVLTRFDNGIAVVDTASRREVAHYPLHNPEPAPVVAGRRFLYDARLTSSNGEAACASCHVFGDLDGLAWDLGNPDAPVVPNPNPVHFGEPQPFHPLKGPMTTQSLRGLAGAGPMHWRGDRTGGSLPDGDPLAEDQAFAEFIVAFEGLLGREAPIEAADMHRFGEFVLEITYPPNPVRPLDGSLTPLQQAGRDLFFGRVTDEAFNCVGCHTVAPRRRHFGADGQSAVQGGPQLFKIPHLRNLYQKVGMFDGDPAAPSPQVRGFGFFHDGSAGSIAAHLRRPEFTLTDEERRQLEAYLLAFDSDLAPIVGQQVTLGPSTGAAAADRVELLRARAEAGDCDLVVHGVVDGEPRGWVVGAGGLAVSDRAADAPVEEARLRDRITTVGGSATYTCVPPGSGVRIALDRDRDGFLDGDEMAAGSDPASAASRPPGRPLPLRRVSVRTSALVLRAGRRAGNATRFAFSARTRRDAQVHRIVPPPAGTALDPTRYGATLRVYNAGFTRDSVTVTLPAGGWRRAGSARRPKGFRFRAADGAVRRALLAPDRLELRGALPYTLDEPAQGRVAVRLAPGLLADGGWCATAPARSRGQRASTAADDRPGRFVGAPAAPPLTTCPPLP